MMPPPGTISKKHHLSSLPEPAPKRKTLAERAGEINNPRPAAPPSGRAVNSAVKATALAGPPRTHSFSSSVSSRATSAASTRTTSATSFSASVGSGIRPPSMQSVSRPQTSMSNSRVAKPTARPATAFGSRDAKVTETKPAWDANEHLEQFEKMYRDVCTKFNATASETETLRDTMGVYKSSVNDLERVRAELTETNASLKEQLDSVRDDIYAAHRQLQDQKRDHEIEIDDLDRQHRNELEDVRQANKQQLDCERADFQEEMHKLRRALEDQVAEEKRLRMQAANEASTQGALEAQRRLMELQNKERDIQAAKEEVERLNGELQRERKLNDDLRENLSTAASNSTTMETSLQALRAKIEYLESDSKSQSEAYADMERKMQEAIDEARICQEKLRAEETLRRKLHNQVQELKGNIRVFCRVRPTLSNEVDETARISFPDEVADGREIEVKGPEEKSSLGTVTTKNNAFAFDKVFGPSSQNQDVFEEISQLIQSALDGYNVCIFCYGQTGSGKTYTMSSEDGMIPRAVHQIYNTAKGLEEKGWTYKMEGSFVEVYNENLNDLLGRADEFDKKKHEIRHDMQTCKTTITDVTIVDLDSPEKVEHILRKAMSNRSMAATKANERSSRSHSIFILKLTGVNSITGEKSDGTLNLVDLAGSERLNHSKVEGARLKETQNINRSLSCLGDVIGALGQGKDGGHIPYRNSKLTYLLQFSLGGNSKTLMFVMVSPLQTHLSETLTSLKFATKVHNTHIGTARKQIKA